MKKIVITVNTSWNIYNFRMDLINLLKKENFEIYAVSPTDEYVKYLTLRGIKHYHISINQKGTNPIKDIKIISTYKKIFKEIKPDIILSYTIKPNIYSALAAGSLNIPIINNISGLGTLFIKKTIFTHIAKLLYKKSLKNSSHIFFQNYDDINLFVNQNLVQFNKISIIPGSGVNTDLFKFKRKSNNGYIFLFGGRLIADKGIREYLAAAKELIKNEKQIEFWIVGDLGCNNKTALTDEEISLCTKNNTQIKYLGKSNNIKKVLSKVDVMVLPSYREGLSKSLIEAASMNLPIITTNVPGCKEVVEDGFNGFLCKVKSKNSLKHAILKMINLSSEERIIMGQNGRKKIIEEFSHKIVNNIYIEKINQILN